MAAPKEHEPDLEPNSKILKKHINEDEKWHNVKGALFLTSVTGMSILFGFGMTLAMAKRKDPTMFIKGLMPNKETPMSGGELAMKALGWGTLYSVTGFSLLMFAAWKALGLNSIKELPEKMHSIMPAVPKKESQGRSDFKSFRELMEYLIDESNKGKKPKS